MNKTEMVIQMLFQLERFFTLVTFKVSKLQMSTVHMHSQVSFQFELFTTKLALVSIYRIMLHQIVSFKMTF